MEGVNEEKANSGLDSDNSKKTKKEDDIGDDITKMLEHYYQQSAHDDDDDDDDEENSGSTKELLVILQDKPVSASQDIQKRSLSTLPEGFTIKPSTVGSDDGVFTRAVLPIGVCLGPYEGEILEDVESPDRYVHVFNNCYLVSSVSLWW